MYFGHIDIEGYCTHEDNDHMVPCKGTNVVSAKCFLEDHTICKFFGWCETKNFILMTNEVGEEIVCKTYKTNDKKSLYNLISCELPLDKQPKD
jgi:hypothetical protein